MKVDTMQVKKKEEHEREAFQLLLSYLQEQESLKWEVDDFFSFKKEKYKLQIDNLRGPNYLSGKWGVGVDVISGTSKLNNPQDCQTLMEGIINKIGGENKATNDYVHMPHQYLMVCDCSEALEQEEMFQELTDKVASLPYQAMVFDHIYLGFSDQTVRLVYAK
jgi:hypothetical protein